MTNANLRSHVTSIGFALTLSKNMIDLLVCLDHFSGDYHEMVSWEYRGGNARVRQFGNYVTSFRALESRGLVYMDLKYTGKGTTKLIDHDRTRHRLTKAGKLTVGLLKEADIYQERHHELGLDQSEEVAS